jgi:hypothetical protein
MHIPSVLVGSVVSGSGFLLIHRELSHRERLSNRWLLAEKIEKEAKTMWNDAKKSMKSSDIEPEKRMQFKQVIADKWNGSIEAARKFIDS